MTSPFLRTVVPASLFVLGTFAGTLAGAQQTTQGAVATPSGTQYATALPSPVLWSSSSPAATAGSADSAGNADGGIPDAPTPQADADGGKQTKRILGIVPNFRAVSANTKLPPMSPKEKLLTATQDSFDYSSLFIPAFLAGYSQATNQTPELHQSAAGYARYYWHSFVD